MANKFISLKNLKFLLNDVHNVAQFTEYDYYKMHDLESFDFMLEAAQQLAEKELYPYYQDMDRNHVPDVVDGKTSTHPQVAKFLEAYTENGWMSATAPEEYGGMQLPGMVHLCAEMIFYAANNAACLFPGLTKGSAKLIQIFGSDFLKKEFMEKMISGEWMGTMCLTEPGAGSSLSDIVTSAEEIEGGAYKIEGQKIFISGGDNNFSENIIHLVLARIKGAPAGTKGISLFVVPKLRKNEAGELIENDVIPAGVYHKMGQRAIPAMHLAFGDNNNCHGYLVGEPNKGLKYMFNMMNGARIEVGVLGAAISSAAYYASLQYAGERTQGRDVNNKSPENPQIPIIEHADVQRMLLLQKAITEGSMSLVLEAGRAFDLKEVLEGDEKRKASLFLDLLTPLVKVYPSEEGIRSVSNGLQIFGGYGYTEDFPLEQMYRDMRITTLYEGTTGIQSMDLLGRKMLMENGAAVKVLFDKMNETIEEANTHDDLKKYAAILSKEMQEIQGITMHLAGFAMKGEIKRFLADANLFMEYACILTVAWQWLKMATKAKQNLVTSNPSQDDISFFESKIHTMKFFFHYEVPRAAGLKTRLMDTETLTMCKDTAILS